MKHLKLYEEFFESPEGPGDRTSFETGKDLGMGKRVTVHAISRDDSQSMTNSFPLNGELKSMVEEWFSQIPFRFYPEVDDIAEDFTPEEIQMIEDAGLEIE